MVLSANNSEITFRSKSKSLDKSNGSHWLTKQIYLLNFTLYSQGDNHNSLLYKPNHQIAQ